MLFPYCHHPPFRVIIKPWSQPPSDHLPLPTEIMQQIISKLHCRASFEVGYGRYQVRYRSSTSPLAPLHDYKGWKPLLALSSTDHELRNLVLPLIYEDIEIKGIAGIATFLQKLTPEIRRHMKLLQIYPWSDDYYRQLGSRREEELDDLIRMAREKMEDHKYENKLEVLIKEEEWMSLGWPIGRFLEVLSVQSVDFDNDAVPRFTKLAQLESFYIPTIELWRFQSPFILGSQIQGYGGNSFINELYNTLKNVKPQGKRLDVLIGGCGDLFNLLTEEDYSVLNEEMQSVIKPLIKLLDGGWFTEIMLGLRDNFQDDDDDDDSDSEDDDSDGDDEDDNRHESRRNKAGDNHSFCGDLTTTVHPGLKLRSACQSGCEAPPRFPMQIICDRFFRIPNYELTEDGLASIKREYKQALQAWKKSRN